MEDVKDPSIVKKQDYGVPNAFSKCANCGVSYHESSNPIESVLLVCLHSFCRNCINNGCLRSEKGDQSKSINFSHGGLYVQMAAIDSTNRTKLRLYNNID